MERLSEHFSLDEMTCTEVRGASNEPGEAEKANLIRLCKTVMEPVRAKFGPIKVNSGYRSPEVNKVIGGSITSAHMKGCATDFVPMNRVYSLREVVEWIVAQKKFEFDQVIYEFGRWVHLGIAPVGRPLRRQALMIFQPGKYLPYDPKGFPGAK